MNTIIPATITAAALTASFLTYAPETPVLMESVAIETMPAANHETSAQQRHIDLALCLDTSGSMDGLLESAKQKLWDIVNNFALATPTPTLRVALLTYGNDGYLSENGWVQVDSVFTEDLDEISKQLFAKTTNGGTELVGRVIHESLEQLDWTSGHDALKVIVVAGNESADQDRTFSYQQACSASINRGIMVNAIYCGDIADNIAPGWREVATLADGHFSAIDQVNGNIVISTPFDDQLVELSSAINETYLPYGEAAVEFASNQWAQDDNAVSQNSATAAQRCVTKASAMYKNSHWDLVDACREEVVKIEEVKVEDLPEKMQKMTVDERRAYVADLQTKRASIQQQVEALNTRRVAFVAQERQRLAGTTEAGFDTALISALQSQASSKGFQFPQPEPIRQRDPATAVIELGDGTLHYTGFAPVNSVRQNIEKSGFVYAVVLLDNAWSDHPQAQAAFDSMDDNVESLKLEVESVQPITHDADLNAFAALVRLNGVEREVKIRLTADPTLLMRYIVRGSIDPAAFGLSVKVSDVAENEQSQPVLTFEFVMDPGC